MPEPWATSAGGRAALAPLQEWMQAVVTYPGDVYEAAEAAAIDVDSVVLPSRTLQPIQRVGIYHGMYMLRMIEALEVDYAAVAHFMGEHAFSDLVRGYVQRFPSRSYTLNRLGDALTEYIADSTLKRRTFLYDLARLELAMTQVFDEAEVEALPAGAIASVPPERIEEVRFTPIPALRLLAFDYDANEAFQEWRDERAIKPRRGKTYVAVHRRDYGVFRMPLSREAFSFLGFLVSGGTIGSAIMTFRRRFRRLPEQEEIFTWFRDWSAAGLFAAIDVTP
ncbi:MAG: DNA-binding domain-containing protein [Acidobacteriota bacterium]|nr:DNA-binding domain-containing protein [Acidobacteriota bacterium]